MEILTMSQKERVRLSVMKQVQEDELKLVEASEVLGLSYRQAKRIWSRYQLQGDCGLVHLARGKPGKRAKPAGLKARILARYDTRYSDFARPWRRSIWPGKGLWWTMRRCGAGSWPTESPGCGAGASVIESGGSASRALGPWCNWMDRITTGLKVGHLDVF
jgi:hypothetical protein